MIYTQAIRTRILHLALQGKLVPHNSSDDSAIDLVSALCKKIKGQSFQNNISQQKIPYDIPDSWVWCHLSDIGTTNIGLTYHPEDVSANGTIVARSSNIVNNKMDYTDLVKVTCPIRDNQFLHTHDILICARNGSKALVGKCAIFEGTPKTVAFGAFMAVFRTPLYRFVYYYFNSQVFKRNFFNDESKQINQVTQSILKKSLIPIPPIQEQERITRKIEQAFSILDTIDKLQAQYADNLTALKSKLIDAAIQGKLTEQLPEDGTAEELYQQIQIEKAKIVFERKGRKDNSILPVDEKIPFEIPEKWKWIRFGETGFFRKGPFGSSLTKSMFVPKSADTIKVYEQQHAIKKDHTLGTYYITKEYFDTSMKGFEVLSGDIIVSCAGTIGETYILPDNIERGIINQALMRITIAPSIDKYFFLYYFDSQLKKSAKDGNGAAIINIPPFDVLKNLYFPLPPLAEQKRIVQKLEEILPLCEKKK